MSTWFYSENRRTRTKGPDWFRNAIAQNYFARRWSFRHFVCCKLVKAKLIFFRRAERNLFAQGHVKMISFFSRLWHPSAFHLFKSNFLGVYRSDSSDFCINTTTCSRSIIFQTFGRQEFFWASLAIKISYFGFFLEANGIFLSHVFTVSFEMLIFLH